MQNLYDYKSQRHYNKFRAGLALIPLSTDPDGVRTVPDGSGRLLVGPENKYDVIINNGPTTRELSTH